MVEQHYNDPNVHRLIVQEKDTQERLGYTFFELIDPIARIAHTAIKLAPSAQSEGFAKDAVKTLMSVAFFQQDINRLVGHIIEFNKPSLKLYTERCWWKIEGKARQAEFLNNRL